MNPPVLVVDCETGEETTRPMTDAELAQWQADVAALPPVLPPTTLADQIAAAVSAGVAAAVPNADAAAVTAAALDSLTPQPTAASAPTTEGGTTT